MCCVLAPGSDSLSSAATSVGAKPNHGFFNCQHLCTIFFRAPASSDGYTFRLRTAVDRWPHAHRRWHRTRRAKNNAQIKVFFASVEHARCTHHGNAIVVGSACTQLDEGVRRLSDRPSATTDSGARTGRFSRKCAKKTRRPGRPERRDHVPREARWFASGHRRVRLRMLRDRSRSGCRRPHQCSSSSSSSA